MKNSFIKQLKHTYSQYVKQDLKKDNTREVEVK